MVEVKSYPQMEGIAGRAVLGAGGDAVASAGVLSRVRPCLSFPAALTLL